MITDDRDVEVDIFAPARLHLGFLDLHGGLGRRFGSLGLTIDGPGTRLRMRRSSETIVTGPASAQEPSRGEAPSPAALGARARRCIETAAAALGVAPTVALAIREAIPEHVGLGSGTQLGLAIAAGLACLDGHDATAAALAPAVGRGARSGIGIGAFDRGGFLVDGGRTDGAAPAPIVARLPFPEAWRILLIFDGSRSGLHGAAETAAFRSLPPFSEALAGQLCRLVLLRLLPGIADGDFAAAADATGEIQNRLGDYFAAAQNGRYGSPAVGRALACLRARGVTGLGQTSWGPTGFALFPSDGDAAAALAELRADRGDWHNLAFRVVSGRNRGAVIARRRRDDGSEP